MLYRLRRSVLFGAPKPRSMLSDLLGATLIAERLTEKEMFKAATKEQEQRRKDAQTERRAPMVGGTQMDIELARSTVIPKLTKRKKPESVCVCLCGCVLGECMFSHAVIRDQV